jgi:hypothetical protein
MFLVWVAMVARQVQAERVVMDDDKELLRWVCRKDLADPVIYRR